MPSNVIEQCRSITFQTIEKVKDDILVNNILNKYEPYYQIINEELWFTLIVPDNKDKLKEVQKILEDIHKQYEINFSSNLINDY